MRVDVFSGTLSKLQTNLLIVTCFKDLRPLKGLAAQVDWYYGGLFSRIMMENRFVGDPGETLLLASGGKLLIPKVILVGLGLSANYDYPQFKFISETMHPVLENLHIRECAIDVAAPMARPLDSFRLVEAFLSGEALDDNNEALEVTFIVKESEKATLQQKYMHHSWSPKMGG